MMLRTLVASLTFTLGAVLLVNAQADAQGPATLKEPESPAALSARHEAAARYTNELLTKFAYIKAEDAAEAAPKVFDRFLDMLDGNRLFLTQEDVARMQVERAGMVPALRGQDLSSVVAMYTLWSQRAQERFMFAQQLLEQGFDFSEDEVWEVREDAPFAPNAAALDDVWRRMVKNDWLRLRLGGQEDDVIRTTLQKRYARSAQRVAEVDVEEAAALFLNAYAGILDPHTNYLAPVVASNFEMSMSLSLEGIGAVLQEQEDAVVIRNLIPGGPALRSEQFRIGDKILAVGQGKDGPLVDVMGWELQEVVGLIRGPGGSAVRLQVQSGEDVATLRVVNIVREKIKLEDQAASRKIIQEQGRKVGVINLPTFYLDFEARRQGDPEARSATADVAKHVRALKGAGVDAIVMDLRGNGGGSLVEALELTGLFIDVGPVVQVHDAEGKTDVQGDADPGALWKGPLAVLVDRNSASASEIFAAAIQDYGRGLILGEPTFGKGTVQTVVSLDEFARMPGANLGQVNLTIAQFYRISGETTQLNGVVPDVAFPVTLDGDSAGEAAMDNALPPSKIPAATYRRLGNPASLAPALRRAHAQRVKSLPELRWWMQDVERFRSERDRVQIDLNEDRRRADLEAARGRQEMRNQERRKLGLAVEAVSADDGRAESERSIAEQVAAEEAAKARAEEDPLLEEAARIVVDALRLDTRALVLK